MAAELLKPVDEKGPDLGALLCLQETMPEGEWREASDAAQVVANYLRCHPAVCDVRYPGLTSDPDYREASVTLRGGFGPWVDLRLKACFGCLRYDVLALSYPNIFERVVALERYFANEIESENR